jgi:hypothetical protein
VGWEQAWWKGCEGNVGGAETHGETSDDESQGRAWQVCQPEGADTTLLSETVADLAPLALLFPSGRDARCNHRQIPAADPRYDAIDKPRARPR